VADNSYVDLTIYPLVDGFNPILDELSFNDIYIYFLLSSMAVDLDGIPYISCLAIYLVNTFSLPCLSLKVR